MRRILSLWSLLIFFAMSSSADPLTAAMYSDPSSCDYLVGTAVSPGGTIYGKGIGIENAPIQSVDLSAYSTLTINTSTTGAWRLIFNQGNNPRFELMRESTNDGSNPEDYYTWNTTDNYTTINVVIKLWKIRQDKGAVRLNAIKNGSGDVGNLTINSMELTALTPTTVSWRNNGSGQLSDPQNLTVGSDNVWGFVVRQQPSNSMISTLTPNDFTIECDNGTATVTTTNNNGQYGFVHVTPQHAGTVTITLSYKGTDVYGPSSATYTFRTAGTEVTLANEGGNMTVTEKYVDDATWNIPITLRNNGNKQTLGDGYAVAGDFNIFVADTNKVISLSRYYVADGNRVYARLTPLAPGKAVLRAIFNGSAVYYPASNNPFDTEITIKKHDTKLTYSPSTYEVAYQNNGTVSGAPTLTQWMDADGTTPTYTVRYISSDPNVATVDANGVVTMLNAGVTTIIAEVVTTKPLVVEGVPQTDGNGNPILVEAYKSNSSSYELTVRGSQNQTDGGVLVWISQLNPATGSPMGGKYRGSYWTQKNVPYYTVNSGSNQTLFNPTKETSDSVNLVTEMPYGNEIIVSASHFNNMDWLEYNPQTGLYEGTWARPNHEISPEYTVQYSTHFFKLKDDTYYSCNEEGLKQQDGARWEWRYNQINNYTDYIPEAARAQDWPTVLRDGTAVTYHKLWMSNIEYSVSDPRLLDGMSEGERVPSGYGNDDDNNGANANTQILAKEYSIRPYPAMDDDGNVTGDSITIYAKIPGSGDMNPIIISTKVKVTKGKYHLTTEPKEGYVTVGEWVIPYVNIPDIKLKDIKKITVWFDDPNVGTVECEVTTNENGQVIYTLYQKDVTSSEWIHTHYDKDSGLDLVDMIYPKITGLIANQTTTMHIKVESPYYYDQECEYILHVLPDAERPKFHWYANDDGKINGKPNSCVMGRDKGVNGPRTIHFGEDDGDIKHMVIYEGDLVHMPGIVGTPNGNDEFSKQGNWDERTQPNPSVGFKYLYGLYQGGKVERNANPYYWREGVPNYFFTTGYTQNGNVYTPVGDPLIPTNHATTDQSALIIKSIAEWGPRGDTLMIYGNKPGTLYLWAQDAQTHLCCTPIELEVKSRESILTEKRNYLSGMKYPYTWDFEHMDMSNIVADREENGSNYWELLRMDEEYDSQNNIVQPEVQFYQANGFFNADYDDKDGDYSYRQHWFKDLVTGKEGYMPQFYGLMLNISGNDYWTQKYNRFQIPTDGSYIYFVGGPHFLQLPGFGINPTGSVGTDETYDYDQYDYNSSGNLSSKSKYENDVKDKVTGAIIHAKGDYIHHTSKDGTRFHDNAMGGWHAHGNTINNSFVDGYGYTSTGSTMEAAAFNGTNAGVDSTVHNRRVRFVIVASGMGDKGAQSSQFHIGGKSMIEPALNENRITWAYRTNDSKRKGTDNKNYQGVNSDSPTEDKYGNENIPGYSKYNLSKNRTLYAFDLDPYDPEYQDHIYLMFNNNVRVYWMGISTEPRDMRSDYDNMTFSYPKDIDLDKTNDLMKTATSDGVRSKKMNDLTKSNTRSIPHHNKVATGGTENTVQFKAFYASGYDRANETLQLERFPDNRIPAGEGALIYPYVGGNGAGYGNSHTFTNQQISTKYTQSGTGGMQQITPANRNVVTFLGFRTETVVKDGQTYTVKVPIYGQKTVKYQYQYLPTYFIANAQNVKDYNTAHGTKSDSKYEFGYQYGYVTPLSAGEAPSAETKNGVIANKSTNLLRGSVYTTYIPKHYTDANNVKWINLGLTNEYIARTLEVGDHKTLLGQVVDDATQQQMTLDTYFELIGPKFVRFYRANKDQNMKNRRAYLTLTWDEYNVNTDGKRGVSYQQLIGNQDPGMWYGYYGTDESLWEDQTNSTTSTNQQFSQHYYGVMLAFGNNGNNNDAIVSEDAGLVDGISEVQSAGNDDVEFYNLNGVRVNTPRKGLYIMNGKKVIVK